MSKKNYFQASKQHKLTDLDPAYIWQWSDFGDYVIFMTIFWGALTLLTWLMADSSKFCFKFYVSQIRLNKKFLEFSLSFSTVQKPDYEIFWRYIVS